MSTVLIEYIKCPNCGCPIEAFIHSENYVSVTYRGEEHDAEKAKNLLEYAYENSKKEDRPRISIEHQRTEHLFGFEMQFGRLEKFEGLYPRRQFVKGGK